MDGVSILSPSRIEFGHSYSNPEAACKPHPIQKWLKSSNKAMLVLTHVIKLTDAVIVGVHHHPETGMLDGSTDKHALEEVSFTFRKIEIEDKIGQTKFADDLSLGGL